MEPRLEIYGYDLSNMLYPAGVAFVLSLGEHISKIENMIRENPNNKAAQMEQQRIKTYCKLLSECPYKGRKELIKAYYQTMIIK